MKNKMKSKISSHSNNKFIYMFYTLLCFMREKGK